MKKQIKKIAAALILAGGVMGIPHRATAEEIVKIIGEGNKVIASYSASTVTSIEFGEGQIAEVADNYIMIPLTDNIKFKMIKVEGGVPYTLTASGSTLTAGEWANNGATKQMEDFWIGEFEVTQDIWKEVMGITDAKLPVSSYEATVGSTIYPVGTAQTKIGDKYPIANVSWNAICDGDSSFLSKINARLKELKANNPALAAALGDKEFRLPNEWEWAYAAAGGKNYASLQYWYSGISGTTQPANPELDKVAVNSVITTLTSVAEVGSKEPNALGLYDMTGNVWERCSGLGYPGHVNEYGYLDNSGTWQSSYRPQRGSSWGYTTANSFRISYRGYDTGTTGRGINGGFRLAL
ncbi:MAG: formylglycine-generating enzyme family protein [Bacteroidales bacterium]|nr:formylglycine-generating enzyme family protein [Bacteroidales bacterium]